MKFRFAWLAVGLALGSCGAAPLPKAPKDAQQAFLKILAGDDASTILKVRIARRTDQGLSLPQSIAETGWRGELVETYLKDSLQKGHVVCIGDLLLQAKVLEGLKLRLTETVADFHKLNPLVPGVSKEALREKLGVRPDIFGFTLDSLVRERGLEMSGELVHLPGRGVVMKDEEAESKKTIEAAFASAGLKVPALRDVLAGLRVDKARAQKIVTLLLRDKVLMKISEDLVFHRDALQDLRKRMAAEKTKSPKIDIARFKDLTGVSRKYAIPLLEYLDREHVTRRVGDERVIL